MSVYYLIPDSCSPTEHFLSVWSNNPDFPNKGDGFDGIVRGLNSYLILLLKKVQIGQDVNNLRSTTGMDPQNVESSLALPQQLFVVPLGGEYFISPSISALKHTFAH